MTFFSVIIPTYNRAHLITKTIDSVLAQTYSHFEVVIVDDGSTDITKQVITDMYGNNQAVRYFYKQNEERGAARNFGIQHASGEYAVFFDSDDLMKPHYLVTLNSIIKEHPGIKLLAAKYNFTSNGKIKNHPVLGSLAEGWYDRSLFLTGNFLACNYCIKIKGNDYKLFPEDRELASMEDWLFLLLNLEKEKIFIRDEVCITMQQHDERSMSNNKKVIEARNRATGWILKQTEFSEKESQTLIAWSHYFCGVHQYLDHNRAGAVKEAVEAVKKAGIKKEFIALLIKAVIGRKLISSIK